VSIPYADQDFRGWSDVTNPNPKKIRLPAEEDEGLDLNGNTFGMLPQSLVASFSDSVMQFADSDVSERVNADAEKQLLQVKMSPSLVAHIKAVLSGEPGLEALLDGCSAMLPAATNGTPDVQPKGKGRRSKGGAAKTPVSKPAVSTRPRRKAL